MIAELLSLPDETTRWLTDKTVLRQVDDWVEVTTPRPMPKVASH